MDDHPADPAFVDFAIGALEGDALHAFEAHVARCDACAARLAEEARFELEMAEVGRAAAAREKAISPPRKLRPPMFARAVPVIAAAAAAVWLGFGRHLPSAEASGPIPNAVCPDGAEQEACIARAHRRGLFVAYPPRGGAPEFAVATNRRGWSLIDDARGDYELSRDTDEHHGGASSARIASKTAASDGAGVLAQTIDAVPWRGRKVRFSAFVKTEDVRGWSGLWMRVDRTVGRTPFDNMQNRPLRGSLRWAEHSVVLEVPEDATSIHLGALQDGAGRTFVDDARFEAVAADVPVTTADDRPLTLTDGGFEKGTLDVDGWFMSGNARAQFSSTIDHSIHHQGAASARISANAAAPNGYGVLMHSMRAEHVRGQRLRLRAFVRGEGVSGRGDFWARVQAVDSPADGPGLGYGACKLEGTFEFRICEMVIDVGERADSIEIGLGLGGPGTAWLDDVTLEQVDATTTPLAIWKKTPEGLENGDFERGGETPEGWRVSGNAFASYRIVVDRDEHHGGTASARLEPKAGATPNGYASIFQSFSAAHYRGKRIRGSAWAKGENVTGRGDVWMRVQGANSPPDGGGLGSGNCRLHDTFDWQLCSVVFDVPPEGAALQVGAGLDGPGRLWLDDVAFEVVGDSVATTNPAPPTARPKPPPSSIPIDLDFENVKSPD